MDDLARMLKEREPVLVDRDDSHWYRTKSGKMYPSVNTILSGTASAKKKESLASWKANEPAHRYITEQAQHIGTQTHQLIEDYLNDSLDLQEFDLYPIAHFNNLRPYLDNIGDVVSAEQPMYWEEKKVAGTADLIAEYNGELSIIDYKTKRKPQPDHFMYEYYLQTTCYAKMFEDTTGKAIDQIVILVSSEKNTRQEFVKSCDNYIKPLEERIAKYHLDRDVP